MKELYEKLYQIQQELKAPKSQYNDYGKYSYRSCEDIYNAVKPLLKELKLTLTMDDELIMVGERYYIKATAVLGDGTNFIENTAYAREEDTKKGMDGSQITGASSSYARKYALNGLFLIDDVKDSDTTNHGEEITVEKAKEFKFTRGKHENKSISEVYSSDKNYLTWYLNNGNNEDIKKMIELITDLKRIPIPSEEEQKKRLELISDLNTMVALTGTDFDEILNKYRVGSSTEMTTEQLEEAIKNLNRR